MEQEIKIIIPSHKRAERINTTKVIESCIVCVPESQADTYKLHNPNTEILAHPDTIKGLPPKLEWIRQYYKNHNIFLVDDDVIDFRRLYAVGNQPIKVNSPSLVREIIEETAWNCRQSGAYLFGFNQSPMPTAYSGFEPISMSGYIMGGATGLLSGSKLYWNVDMKLKGDFWISLLNAYHHRYIWKDMRFAFSFKDTFCNPGGLSEIRNNESEEESVKILKHYFGNSFKKKEDTKLSKRKHAHMITLQLPF